MPQFRVTAVDARAISGSAIVAWEYLGEGGHIRTELTDLVARLKVGIEVDQPRHDV